MKLTLEPYQEWTRDHLIAHDRAALFVGLGLGKTSATLSALNQLFQEGQCKAALVIAPLRVACLTWPNEIEKWDQFRWMKVESLRDKPPSGKADVYTLNYESLHKLRSLDFCDTVILDELTKCKNHQSKRIAALRKLFRTHRRWGLTGTPRPNSLLELFAQVRVLDDGTRLGRSFTTYRDTYFTPTDYMQYNWVPKAGAEDAIYRKIADLALTLRSSDYLDIPETRVEDIEIPLPDAAKAQYKELEKQFLLLHKPGDDIVAQSAAVLVNKLLQVCSGFVYTENRTVVTIHDAKIQALIELLKVPESGSVLIACNYIHEREAIVQATGAVDASTFKGDIEAAWNSRKVRLLVADPRSLGHGLNLQQGGRTIVWFSPTWSRELYDQFNARLARKGQTEETIIYRIIATGTIDEAVIGTLRSKGEGQSQMLEILTSLQKIVKY